MPSKKNKSINPPDATPKPPTKGKQKTRKQRRAWADKVKKSVIHDVKAGK